jgi:hypothetical protein
VISTTTDILHYSQQDQKNRVSQRKIQVFTISYSQETPAVATTGGTTKGALPRFFTQVQDLRLPTTNYQLLTTNY